MTALGADELDVLLDDLVMRLTEQDITGAVKLFDLLLVLADITLSADIQDQKRLGVFGWAVVTLLVGARDHEILSPLIQVEHRARIEVIHG